MDLFEYQNREETQSHQPLAERMRPDTLDMFFGQTHAVGPETVIRHAIAADTLFSMILWGPPGCGKTTLATIFAQKSRAHFVRFSAVLSGVKDIRAVIADARSQRHIAGKKTILFVDEIHRFNKAQQDAFLHHVESGLITLIGATTENPSFEIIPPLLSRCRVIVLEPLSPEEIGAVIHHALKDREKGLGKLNLTLDSDALSHLVRCSRGDARAALNNLEIAASFFASLSSYDQKMTRITLENMRQALQDKALSYDKSGEAHYNLISAFHKSLRGSDPDAALYWLGRMLAAGEDPFYVARRMVRFASEDVGNADPQAMSTALAAVDVFKFIGPPEGELALAQAAVYLACAPKSNRVYTAYEAVKKEIRHSGALPVPLAIRNAPTRLMQQIGYGKHYKYAHDYENGYVPQEYLPEKLGDLLFYHPTERGYEKMIKKRLDRWRRQKQKDVRDEQS
jgi:putative ATPase